MNKHIKLALIFAAAALAGTGCTVDDYNDAYLDGFDSDQEVTDIQTVSYTLTDADYSSVANNAANKAIAEAAGPEAVEALAAVGTAKYASPRRLPPRPTCRHSYRRATTPTCRTVRR